MPLYPSHGLQGATALPQCSQFLTRLVEHAKPSESGPKSFYTRDNPLEP